MCWTHWLWLPQASVAVQVRSIPAWPVQLAADTSVCVIVGVPPPQLSVAVAVPVFDGSLEAPHWRAASAGHVITGAVVSTTVTVFVQVLVQPAAFVIVRPSMNDVLQPLPAVTETVWP